MGKRRTKKNEAEDRPETETTPKKKETPETKPPLETTPTPETKLTLETTPTPEIKPTSEKQVTLETKATKKDSPERLPPAGIDPPKEDKEKKKMKNKLISELFA